jgi:hypothetical protein
MKISESRVILVKKPKHTTENPLTGSKKLPMLLLSLQERVPWSCMLYADALGRSL